MPAQRVTIFGGTGFLGRRVVCHLRDSRFAVRIATRHPDRAHSLFSGHGSSIESVHADVNDETSVAAAVSDAWAVVNAVSLYVERGKHTFRSIHVEAAERLARLARQAGVERIVHVSGIGADARSASPYIRSRGEGEVAALHAFPSATIIRPAIMFGPGDALVTPLSKMLGRMPLFPMFGRGQTKLQPAHVEDVAEAIARVLQAAHSRAAFELAGPHVYTYESLLKTIAASMGRKPLLLPFPFMLWRVIAMASEFLPHPPITEGQVELMRIDNIAAPDAPGFDVLQIPPQAIEAALPQILQGE